MRMNRREFLKGMLALTGAAVLTEIAPLETLLAAENKYFISPAKIRPVGRLGSVRIGNDWYALEDSMITMLRRHTPSIYAPMPTPGGYMVVRESQLIASPWQIDFFVKEEIALDLLKGSGEIDFEIDSGTSSDRLRLGGEGWLESVGVENTVSTWEENNGPLFQIHLEGDRKLVRL